MFLRFTSFVHPTIQTNTLTLIRFSPPEDGFFADVTGSGLLN